MNGLAALVGGLIFGFGLVVSGMTEPGNVIQFLNLGPDWSPALMFVMGSALTVAAIGYRVFGSRATPLFSDAWNLPNSQQIDGRLAGGAVLFGVGWGIAGFCPGPAIVGAFGLDPRALWFIAAYVAGVYLFEWMDRRAAKAAVADG